MTKRARTTKNARVGDGALEYGVVHGAVMSPTRKEELKCPVF
ncbi:hypothetical protein BQ1740_0280 [Bacillus subtilis]|nr:hypothetical protein BQ1740_0280 [Bacillus subtilis]